MKSCCVTTLETMQELRELQSWLKLFLWASPYIVLLPELGSGVLNEGIRETAKGYLQDMLIEKALDKATGAGDLPDVKEALASVDAIVLRKLCDLSQIHCVRHTGSEMRLWNTFVNLYDPTKQPAPVESGGSWWNPFD